MGPKPHDRVVDIPTVADLMGHRTIQMTVRKGPLAPARNQERERKPGIPVGRSGDEIGAHHFDKVDSKQEN